MWHLIIRANICALPLANCIRRTNRVQSKLAESPSIQKVFLLRGAKIGLWVLVLWVFLVGFYCLFVYYFFFLHVHVITLPCPTSNFKYLVKIFLLLGLEWAFPIAREPQTFIRVKQRLRVWFKKKKKLKNPNWNATKQINYCLGVNAGLFA